MKLWPWRKRMAQPTEEATHAAAESVRGLLDAQAMHKQASDSNRKAEDVASRLEQTRQRNHFADAVAESMERLRRT